MEYSYKYFKIIYDKCTPETEISYACFDGVLFKLYDMIINRNLGQDDFGEIRIGCYYYNALVTKFRVRYDKNNGLTLYDNNANDIKVSSICPECLVFEKIMFSRC